MDMLAAASGRSYHLFDYHGHPQAERVVVAMGSAVETIEETVDWLVARGEKVGVVAVRLFLPFSVKAFLAALPATAKAIAVLDRTKEPGSLGEPLYLNVVGALAEGDRARAAAVRVCGGRYGLGSKEFTPGMARAVFERLSDPAEPGALHGRHLRRRDRHLAAVRRRLRPGAAGRPALRVRGPRRRRHGRGQQELDQDHRRADRQLRAGLLRLRLEEVGLDDRVAPALRPAADPRAVPDPPGGVRRLQPVQLRRQGRDPGLRGPGRHRAPEFALLGRRRPGASFPASGRRR